MQCPDCKSPRMGRVSPRGFVQTAVCSLLGLNPWLCRYCLKMCLVREHSYEQKGSQVAKHA
jgi:hypothetical protein